ncbi:MAG: LPS export ABC transporter periplasmic protein LptC [Muribaculaceae bacterium]|nr:LPS export ABC transporter periplasmic protein LptC [Muribaculaceae bacterium]
MSGLRTLPAAAAVLIASAACVISGCKQDNPVATTGDIPVSTPTMTTRDVETLISDSGVVRYKINTPIWYVYDDEKEPYWNFPEGLDMEKFNDLFQRDATVHADSAIYFKNKQLWRLDGSVSISNMQGEKFLTEQLFWDQRQHKLYSDSFIHIERSDRVLEGYGFDSDERLTRYTIRRVSGIFPASEFKRGTSTRQQEPEATQPETPDSTANT